MGCGRLNVVAPRAIDPATPRGLDEAKSFVDSKRRRDKSPFAAAGVITEPSQAQGILDRAEADTILLARAAIRKPNWPLRAASAELGRAWHDAPYPPRYTCGTWDDVVDRADEEDAA